MSADGRYVTFVSAAPNLHPGDLLRPDNPRQYTLRSSPDLDLFVHDRTLRTTTMVSLDSQGDVADGPTLRGAISPDGGHILLQSHAHLTAHPRPVRDDGSLAPLAPMRLYLHQRAVAPSFSRPSQ